MLTRPSSRRKSKQEGIALNLVPILDCMVTLIAFLLFTMSFMTLVHIESPIPEASSRSNEEKLKTKPLQLTLSLRENEAEIWSPFELIAAHKIPNIAPGMPDIKTIHESLIAIKLKFPTENQIVFAPFAGASYDTLISAMDTVRTLEKSDTPVFIKNAKTGLDEPQKTLFSDIVFGNLLGDS